ncbi:MAG: sigma-70 family RNA polymerase sigma factor [Acidobacteria bacterium]|nr:sigma-70 family RNA polymerase sigma factor [Acidobacteriota bacterium]
MWRFGSPEDLDTIAEPEEPADHPRADEIPTWLAHASPRSRAVIVLHYLEEMPLKEVAAVLGLPLGTVKSRLAYGLRAMRQAAGEKDEPGFDD